MDAALNAELHPNAEGFWRQWVYVDAAKAAPLLQLPSVLAEPSHRWEREELVDPRLAQVLVKLAELKKAGVTMAMVVREFSYQ